MDNKRKNRRGNYVATQKPDTQPRQAATMEPRELEPAYLSDAYLSDNDFYYDQITNAIRRQARLLQKLGALYAKDEILQYTNGILMGIELFSNLTVSLIDRQAITEIACDIVEDVFNSKAP